MRFVILFKQDCNSPQDKLSLGEYVAEDDPERNAESAKKALEKIILDYITKQEGRKQAEIAMQEKTPEEIKDDDDLPNNHYVRVENGVYFLYEKYKEEKEITESGWFGSTTKKIKIPAIKKICFYDYIVHNLEIYNYISRCACNAKAKASTKSSIESQENVSYLDEMKSIFERMRHNAKKNKDVDDDSDDDTVDSGIGSIMSKLDFGKNGKMKYPKGFAGTKAEKNDEEKSSSEDNELDDFDEHPDDDESSKSLELSKSSEASESVVSSGQLESSEQKGESEYVESNDVESNDLESSDVESSDEESNDVESNDVESNDLESSDVESSDESDSETDTGSTGSVDTLSVDSTDYESTDSSETELSEQYEYVVDNSQTNDVIIDMSEETHIEEPITTENWVSVDSVHEEVYDYLDRVEKLA